MRVGGGQGVGVPVIYYPLVLVVNRNMTPHIRISHVLDYHGI